MTMPLEGMRGSGRGGVLVRAERCGDSSKGLIKAENVAVISCLS